MKTLSLLLLVVLSASVLSAQNPSPIPAISQKLTDYFTEYPIERTMVTTDKTLYRPGETVWFHASVYDGNQQLMGKKSSEFLVKLYDSKGKSVLQEIFRLKNGSISGDLALPKDLEKGIYMLCTCSGSTPNPEELSVTFLDINPGYSNHWIMETSLRDSISLPGQKNEIFMVLRDLFGKVEKNKNLWYQLLNGETVLEKGKLKTDEKGKISFSFVLPQQSNEEPFVFKVNDNKEEWTNDLFLPSGMDPIAINFYPEGGNINSGTNAKIGFTAFNKWGIPVDVNGAVFDQEGQKITNVRTFTKGLGLFSFESVTGKKYKLVLSGSTGSNQWFELPSANTNGLSLSVVKNDGEFIITDLAFSDRQKHSVAIAVTAGTTLYWAADMDIDKVSRVKIPTESLPQGINLLSVFSKEGALLAERIIYLDKKQRLNIAVQPEKNTLSSGESMKITVALRDENNQPVAGKVVVSVADKFRSNLPGPRLHEQIMIASEVETPFSLISDALQGKILSSTLLDLYLISNRLISFSWDRINSSQTKSLSAQTKDKTSEEQLSSFLIKKAMSYNLMYKNSYLNTTYCTSNEEIFQRAPKLFKANTIALDNQRKMLSSASSLLDVIKTIKPYKIMNNQIVFIGSENSFNYQGGALIVLDGQQLSTDISALTSISPMDVDHINVSTNPMDIQKYTGLNSVGVIEIYQKRAVTSEVESKTKGSNKDVDGFRIPEVFQAIPSNRKNDFRTTLQWIPENAIDKAGILEFSVTASKVVSEFMIEVQGITEDGRCGIGKASFSVVR